MKTTDAARCGESGDRARLVLACLDGEPSIESTDQVNVATIRALSEDVLDLRGVLERIAWPQFEKDADGRPVGCRCGHRYEMCHAVNVARYCGGDALRALTIARQALGYYDALGIITPAGQARYDELKGAQSDGRVG